jgi:hypothetical protein
MKRAIILTIALTTLLSVPVYAQGYSEESKRLGQEAGCYVGDYDLDEVLARQEALKNGQANNSTPTTQNGQNKANKPVTGRIKGGVDEYRVIPQGGNESTKITDTKDGLHIYSNEYSNPTGYSKYSNDEFSIRGQDTPANDRYNEDSFDQLHIDKIYQDRLWYPENEVKRLSIDQFRLPNDPIGW